MSIYGILNNLYTTFTMLINSKVFDDQKSVEKRKELTIIFNGVFQAAS